MLIIPYIQQAVLPQHPSSIPCTELAQHAPIDPCSIPARIHIGQELLEGLPLSQESLIRVTPVLFFLRNGRLYFMQEHRHGTPLLSQARIPGVQNLTPLLQFWITRQQRFLAFETVLPGQPQHRPANQGIPRLKRPMPRGGGGAPASR